MILHLGYEELAALKEGARLVLSADASAVNAPDSAPVAVRQPLTAMLPMLTGDVGIRTLAEQREWTDAVETIVERLRHEMEVTVAATHPADELAVASYFGFAHAYTALDRLRRMGREMTAMIEVVTGSRADSVSAAEFVFPD